MSSLDRVGSGAAVRWVGLPVAHLAGDFGGVGGRGDQLGRFGGALQSSLIIHRSECTECTFVQNIWINITNMYFFFNLKQIAISHAYVIL